MKIYNYDGKSNICGERVRFARDKQNITQEQLAARLQIVGLEISQKAISRVENGVRVVPDFELPLFAKVLNVSISWLLNLE